MSDQFYEFVLECAILERCKPVTEKELEDFNANERTAFIADVKKAVEGLGDVKDALHKQSVAELMKRITETKDLQPLTIDRMNTSNGLSEALRSVHADLPYIDEAYAKTMIEPYPPDMGAVLKTLEGKSKSGLAPIVREVLAPSIVKQKTDAQAALNQKIAQIDGAKALLASPDLKMDELRGKLAESELKYRGTPLADMDREELDHVLDNIKAGVNSGDTGAMLAGADLIQAINESGPGFLDYADKGLDAGGRLLSRIGNAATGDPQGDLAQTIHNGTMASIEALKGIPHIVGGAIGKANESDNGKTVLSAITALTAGIASVALGNKLPVIKSLFNTTFIGPFAKLAVFALVGVLAFGGMQSYLHQGTGKNVPKDAHVDASHSRTGTSHDGTGLQNQTYVANSANAGNTPATVQISGNGQTDTKLTDRTYVAMSGTGEIRGVGADAMWGSSPHVPLVYRNLAEMESALDTIGHKKGAEATYAVASDANDETPENTQRPSFAPGLSPAM